MQNRNTPNQAKREKQQQALDAKAKSVKSAKRQLKSGGVKPAASVLKGKKTRIQHRKLSPTSRCTGTACAA